MLADVGWKLTEIYRPGIYRTMKRTDIAFVVIPGIEESHSYQPADSGQYPQHPW